MNRNPDKLNHILPQEASASDVRRAGILIHPLHPIIRGISGADILISKSCLLMLVQAACAE